MKLYRLIAIFALVLLNFSCKKNYQEININKPVELGLIVNNTITLDQANKIALINSIYPEPLKRTKKYIKNGNVTSNAPEVVQQRKDQKTIKSSHCIKDEKSEPILYIINYNEGGFVIVSGDKRMLPILAYGDKNNFRESDTTKIDNPGLRYWLRENIRFISAIKNGIVKGPKFVESAWKDLERKSKFTSNSKSAFVEWPPCEDESDLNEVFAGEDWEVLLPTALFGQNSPFNDFIAPHPNCATPLVGCVAVATAVIMKYWEFPTNLYNWSSINNSGTVTNETKDLLRDSYDYLGRDLGIWRSVSCSATGAPYFLSTWALNDLGYSNDTFNPFNVYTVKTDIAAGRPVILSGGSHQWVANGVRQYTVYTCLESEDEEEPPIEWRNPPPPTYGWVETNSYTYLYMNWGWEGDDNDWYISYAWNPVNNGSNYSSNMRALTGIHP